MVIGNVGCVVFDLDDTLWNAKEELDACYEAMCVAISETRPEFQASISDQDSFRDEMKTTMSNNPDKKHDFNFVRTETLSRLTDAETATIAFDAWLQRRNRPTFFPGALEALQELRDTGIKIGTLTDGNADVSVIGALEAIVDFHVSAVEAGAPKPDRRAFALCEARSGCAPANIVMVGDNIEKDVLGAQSAGWKSIWVQPSFAEVAFAGSAYDLSGSKTFSEEEAKKAADANVKHVVEVKDILRSWAGDNDGDGQSPVKGLKCTEDR
ncbi:unnamed protein product [Prorocentrum cordatum]|uniref:Uncharacterized protein n=1 Tax=Prorocentrum cordatum TaxID=2364126 RepID=A0ABN9Q1U3_9DINO|nr:unnamed protein product [Polarella glacialis]